MLDTYKKHYYKTNIYDIEILELWVEIGSS